MPVKVYNNVAGFRLYNDGRVTEDVTAVTLPDIKHPTDTIDVAGMAVAVDMPNHTHLDAMELSVAHNNGVNCRYLIDPGKHFIELRTARQCYNVNKGNIDHESVKYRMTCVHKESSKGSVELNNPLGSTEKYSVLRYEEEIDGEVVTLIDAMAGTIKINGVDYTSAIESML